MFFSFAIANGVAWPNGDVPSNCACEHANEVPYPKTLCAMYAMWRYEGE
jgi:hypothetical protein